MKLNPWCWLQTVNKVQYDCTIKCSIIEDISIFEISTIFQPNNVSYMSLLET